jgi:hypothetical protein
MADTRTVGVKELKNNLSAYLREVRRGTRLLVTDRDVVVAELHEPGASYAAPGQRDPILDEWVRDGIVTLPMSPREPIPDSGVRLDNETALRWLAESRHEGQD